MSNQSLKEKQRPLVYERLHYRAPFGYVTMMARLEGAISKEQLMKALTELTSKYPLMGARIEQLNDGSAKFVVEGASEYAVTVSDKKDDKQWLQIAMDEQKKPFNLNKGPLIRFILLNSAYNSDIILVCHHTICDGLSLTYLVKDIIKLLNEPSKKVEPKPLPPTVSEENFTVKVSTGFLVKLLLNYFNRSWKKAKVIFTQEDYEKIHQSYWDSNKIQVRLLTLPKELTTHLLSCCHQEKVSVNSAIIAAFTFAQNDLQGTNPSFSENVGVAMNIRHFFKENAKENFGLLAAGNVLTVTRKDREGFWAVAKKTDRQAKKILASPKKVLKLLAFNYLDSGLIDAMWFTAHGDFKNKTALRLKKMFLNPSENPKRKIGTTNLGKVANDGSEQAYKLKTLFFIPPYWETYEKVIGIVTAAETMNISILYDSRYVEDNIMEQFRMLTLKYIEEATAHGSSA